ncbi:MAG: 3-methyl-2-oxobutanoate hydroxymethyltransferase [Flaviflexus sp.]|nr:3-methyl-2-oxobutanoate hydroxymethyltransferase [Flaviflexus sp.]
MTDQPRRMRIVHLAEAKAHRDPITMLTAYDAVSSRIFDEAGIDMLLIGDSIGMTMFGRETTIGVELDEIIVATRAVARGVKRSLIVSDLPFGTYETGPAQCLDSAVQLIKAGANAVKFEGGVAVAEQIKACTDHGIPVVGHIGFTPQAENALSGPRVQGRTDDGADRLVEDAYAIQEAGASAIVLELIPQAVAERITKILEIPTIGIGAGPHTDGQVLVWTDMAGIGDWRPSFAPAFGNVEGALRDAASSYIEAVKSRAFPTREHSF